MHSHVKRRVFANRIEPESKLPIPREERDRHIGKQKGRAREEWDRHDVRKTNGKGRLKVWKGCSAAVSHEMLPHGVGGVAAFSIWQEVET
eukprot:gene26001-biopygen12772